MEEEIRGQFEMFNIKPSQEVIAKCLKMCDKYKIDGEDLVDQWFAFTSSKLRGANPTVEYLEQMERKELMKQKVPATITTVQELSPVANSSKAATSEGPLSTPKRNHVPVSRIQTPIQTRNTLEETMSSPSILSQTYSKRTDALSVRCSHNSSKATFKKSSNFDVSVRPLYEDGLQSDRRFMYEVLRKRKQGIDNMTEDLALAIIKKYYNEIGKCNHYLIDKLDMMMNEKSLVEDKTEEFDYEKQNVHIEETPEPNYEPDYDSDLELEPDLEPEPTAEPEREPEYKETLVCGRIVSDSNGKINSQSILLEETAKLNGNCYSLNLSKLPKYSLFCGQVVVVKGESLKKTNRNILLAEEIYTDTDFKLPQEPPLIRDTLQMIVACGPFTPQDNLSFEPLTDLLKYVREHQPHVLLLTGPFYHKDHPGIFNGELRQTVDTFFLDLIDTVMQGVPSNTHVLVVSSHKEPHHYPVYPTIPYEIAQRYSNLTFMPDPCMVNINGLVVAATTADILFDIGSYEIHVDKTNSAPSDRMGRLASYLFKQESFYPLEPVSKDLCIDFSLMERNGVMALKPHVMILPSILRFFIKELDDVLVVNPEKLTKGNSGGTFARLEISPGASQTVCGCLKGSIGICCSKKIGEYGMPMLMDLPKPLDYYQELELKGRDVCYDVVGWPVHPDTGERTVRVLPVKTEFCLNIIFFLAYPLALFLKLCAICCCIRDYEGEQDEFFKEVNVIKYNSGKNHPGPKVDVYRDKDLREAKDTRYIINCMRESQIALQELNKFKE
ncbi:unnamed protein product [Ceutorhynchus assimilis]|uniref:DNA polymerase alpha subunit B n=1 Tax=Ceutorhynchus assimilis TaxID=467358 RepID=A0A9N9QD91_9CUCU|nr:unnamed protein product [Ceutorhynchus assimilis]